MQTDNRYLEIFKNTYSTEKVNLEDVIMDLKEAGASQMDCVKTLIICLDIQLKEADNLVLNSIHWKEEKTNTEMVRHLFLNALLDSGSN